MATLTVTATSTQAPTGMPTVGATPTPRPTGVIRYQLIDGSTILFVPQTPSPSPAASEALSGTFTVAGAEPPPPTPSANDVFRFTITSIDLQTASGLMLTSGQPETSGCGDEMGTGCMEATTLDPRVFMSLAVSINGEQIELGGAGLWEGAAGSPIFHNVEVCGSSKNGPVDCQSIHDGTGSGYDLTIFAVPEG